MLAAGLGVLAGVDDPHRAPAGRLGDRCRRLLAFSIVPVVSAAAWFGFFQIVYGTPNPIFPYGEDRGTRLAYVPGGLLGLFFDAQFGLLAYSPVLAAGLIGLFVRPAGAADPVRRIARGTAARRPRVPCGVGELLDVVGWGSSAAGTICGRRTTRARDSDRHGLARRLRQRCEPSGSRSWPYPSP